LNLGPDNFHALPLTFYRITKKLSTLIAIKQTLPQGAASFLQPSNSYHTPRCRPDSTTTASEASATPSAYSLYALCIGRVGGKETERCAHVSHGCPGSCVCFESTKQIKFYSTLLSTFMHSEVTRPTPKTLSPQIHQPRD